MSKDGELAGRGSDAAASISARQGLGGAPLDSSTSDLILDHVEKLAAVLGPG
jgi:hypothetical protein